MGMVPIKFMLTLRQTCEHADVSVVGVYTRRGISAWSIGDSVMLYNSSHLS